MSGKRYGYTETYIFGISRETWLLIAWIIVLSLVLITFIITKDVWMGILFVVIASALISVQVYARYKGRKRKSRRRRKR
ncbi:MAG: hypothetical protein JSV76_05715 [Candidatus Bathyarchaeota archaeon]|nr:MAG: hypothetical protein JSV76_05715 [Candidatus Bathyarchaeota archaeon]